MRIYTFLGTNKGFSALDSTASIFGGPDDIASKQDNGVSFKGYRYVEHPDCLGVALPVGYGRDLHAYSAALIPFTGNNHGTCTKVRILSQDTGVFGDFAFVDDGPNQSTGRSVDMLPATARVLKVNVKKGLFPVDVWILPPTATFIGVYPAVAKGYRSLADLVPQATNSPDSVEVA